MTVKTATDLVVLCENTLGWVPDSDKPLLKARRIMAGRINKKVSTNPTLYTWHNLELTVELMRRRRQLISSPMYLFFKVEEALQEANEAAKARPIGELIDYALAEELKNPTPSQDWIGQLTRAAGNARREVYDEWVAERGVQ